MCYTLAYHERSIRHLICQWKATLTLLRHVSFTALLLLGSTRLQGPSLAGFWVGLRIDERMDVVVHVHQRML